MYFGETDKEIYENVKAMNQLARKVAAYAELLPLLRESFSALHFPPPRESAGFCFPCFLQSF